MKSYWFAECSQQTFVYRIQMLLVHCAQMALIFELKPNQGRQRVPFASRRCYGA